MAGSSFPCNISKYGPDYMPSHPRKEQIELPPLKGSKISQVCYCKTKNVHFYSTSHKMLNVLVSNSTLIN
jgi:hypothetical protein